MSEPQTLAEWRGYATTMRSKSRWRRRAVGAMFSVVDANPWAAPRALLKLVDAAYPFEVRKHHPYTIWLRERQRFMFAVGLAKENAPAPTMDEAQVCEVARDMVELGDAFEARVLLEQAPNRLNRKCPVCGEKIGRACIERIEPETREDPCFVCQGAGRGCGVCRWRGTIQVRTLERVELLVPHEARVSPDRGPPPSDNATLPLFGGGG